jgi:PTS system nitrogen regulatory IIA component
MGEDLLRLFDPNHCTFGLRSTQKDAALQEILALVAPPGSPHHQSLVEMLRKREAMGTTAALKGIALPHGRSLAVNRLTGLFARSSGGVAFGAADGLPTHVFFVLLSPPHDGGYLPALGRIVEVLQNDALRHRLFGVESYADFAAVLRGDALGQVH